ncbi:hypothetical protein Tco_0264295 [Tanacetum coccineum]
MGIKFEDEIQGLWLLDTLPDTWETFRTSLSNSAPDGVITMEESHKVPLHIQMSWSQKGRGEVKVEAPVTEKGHTFIDDHSRKVWVYTLKTKDQVLDVFKQFYALVERQTWKNLNVFELTMEVNTLAPLMLIVESM